MYVARIIRIDPHERRLPKSPHLFYAELSVFSASGALGGGALLLLDKSRLETTV